MQMNCIFHFGKHNVLDLETSWQKSTTFIQEEIIWLFSGARLNVLFLSPN